MNNTVATLYVIAAVIVGFGFLTMYHYDSSGDFGRLVGGDAYNYIIIGVRGVGWIVTGFIVAVIASATWIVSAIRESAQKEVAIAPPASETQVSVE